MIRLMVRLILKTASVSKAAETTCKININHSTVTFSFLLSGDPITIIKGIDILATSPIQNTSLHTKI